MIFIQILNHILEGLCVYAYLFSYYPHHRSPWIDRLIAFIGYAFLFGIYQIQILNLNLIAMLFTYVILFHFLVCISWRSSINNSLIVFSTIVLSELLVDSGTILFDSGTTFSFDNLHFFLLMSVIVRIINTLFFALIILLRRKYNDRLAFLCQNIYITIALFELSIALIAIQNLGFITILEKKEIFWVYVTIISFVILCFAITILGGHLQQERFKYLNTLNELQAKKDAENYNQLITQLDNDQKIMIHDFKNHFITIKALINDKSYEEALKYADDMIDSPAIITGRVLTDNQTLTVLLSRYLAMCKENNISVEINVKNARFSSYTPGDITSLFGNLLDNSVESCLTSTDPYIDLEISWNDEKACNVIILSNSCDSAPVLGKNGEYITQKTAAANHGIGIKSIKKTVQKYHGLLHQYYSAENLSFNTIITIGKDVL